MKTIAVEIDESVLTLAEKKAQELSTSVPAVVAEYLRKWATDDDRLADARRQMKELFASSGRRFEIGTPDTREERNARR